MAKRRNESEEAGQLKLVPDEEPERHTRKAAAAPVATRLPDAEAADAEGDGGGRPARQPRQRRRATAESMASKQRDISVAEFFTKNRHLLGFDNPAKALLTTTKEAVDNALDACEDAGILPDISVTIAALNNGSERFRVTVKDNGPGIVKAQIPKIFAKLLYGSKFHTLKQARGQQGIGISAAGMYGQLTTGAPIRIRSRTKASLPVNCYSLRIDTEKNNPEILSETTGEEEGWDHGTEVTIDLEATYRHGAQSVETYIEQTVVANPHATVRFAGPEGDPVTYVRTTNDLPPEAQEMKPHPYGVELGMLLRIFQAARGTTVKAALQSSFSRVSPKVAAEISEKAGLPDTLRTSRITPEQVEAVYRAIREVKIMAPPSSSVVPIGEDLIIEGLKRRFEADFYFSCTRSPTVYRGNPFVIEAGIAFGGDMPADQPAQIMRFANRVPLLYQKGACAITEAVEDTQWRHYGLQQPRGSLPIGPMAILVHMASAWVPFTSESKEAVAHYPEIVSEIKLALQACGRKMGTHIRYVRRENEALKRRGYIEKYLPHIGIALKDMLGFSDAERDRINEQLRLLLERKPGV